MNWITSGWVTAVVAILAPIIVALINNHYQAKIKKAEIMENRGLSVIEEYLRLASDMIGNQDSIQQYRESYAKVFLYAPSSVWENIKKLNTQLKLIPSSSDGQITKEELYSLIEEISKSLTI